MKQIIIKITRWLTLLLSWFIISPLFVYLAGRWKLIGKKMGLFLLLISPFMLVVYLIIALFIMQGYFDYQRKYRFADNDVIERITGIPFPELDIIEYEKSSMSFHGDYNDCLKLQMENDLDGSTYLYLDSIINNGDTGWSKRNDEYSYSIMWGNGFPAPQGEDEEEDMTFSLSMKKGSKIVSLEYGSC